MVVLDEQHVQDSRSKKEDGEHDSGVKKTFFDAAFCSKYLTSSAKSRSEARSALLEQDRGDEKDGEQDLDQGK